ncbi:MAG: hypothetical protein ACF8PN_05050 [Phycisphaerales bacterium]
MMIQATNDLTAEVLDSARQAALWSLRGPWRLHLDTGTRVTVYDLPDPEHDADGLVWPDGWPELKFRHGTVGALTAGDRRIVDIRVTGLEVDDPEVTLNYPAPMTVGLLP